MSEIPKLFILLIASILFLQFAIIENRNLVKYLVKPLLLILRLTLLFLIVKIISTFNYNIAFDDFYKDLNQKLALFIPSLFLNSIFFLLSYIIKIRSLEEIDINIYLIPNLLTQVIFSIVIIYKPEYIDLSITFSLAISSIIFILHLLKSPRNKTSQILSLLLSAFSIFHFLFWRSHEGGIL